MLAVSEVWRKPRGRPRISWVQTVTWHWTPGSKRGSSGPGLLEDVYEACSGACLYWIGLDGVKAGCILLRWVAVNAVWSHMKWHPVALRWNSIKISTLLSLSFNLTVVAVSLAGLVGITNVDFSDVCRHYLGRWAEILSVIFSLIALLGGAVVYWVLMSNFLFHSVTFIHGLLTFQ